MATYVHFFQKSFVSISKVEHQNSYLVAQESSVCKKVDLGLAELLTELIASNVGAKSTNVL